MSAESAEETGMKDTDNTDVGVCEGCTGVLRSGDMAVSCEEGILLCAKCAPTNKDVYDQLVELDDDCFAGGPVEKATRLAAIQSQIDGGAAWDDKPLISL